MNNYYLFVSLLTAFLWGSATIINKKLLTKYNAISMMFFSSSIYFLCLLSVVPFQYETIRGDIARLTNMELLVIFLSATLAGFSANYLYYYVLKSNDSSIVSAVVSTSPLFTLLLAYFLLKEKMTLIAILGIFFIVIGIVCISVSDSSLNEFFANRE